MDPYKRVTLVYALFSFASVLTDPVFSLYLNMQGYSAIWVSIILSSFSLTSIVAAPIIGGISDSWGRRPLMIAGIVLNAIAYMIYATIHHPIAIFFTRGLEAVGYYLVVLVAVSKLEEIVNKQKAKNANQRIGMGFSIAKIGYIIGPLLGGILAYQYGILSPFWATALAMLVLGTWYLSLKAHPYPKLPMDPAAFNPIPKIREFLRIRPFKGLSIMVFVMNVSLAAYYVFLPLHIVSDLHLGYEQVGFALFVQQLPLLFQFLAGKLTDKMGSKRVMLIGMIICSLGLVGTGLAKTYDWLLVALLLNGIGQSIFGISSLSLLTAIAKKMKREATFLGSQISVSRVGTFTGYMIIGLVVAASDISTLFILCGVLLLLGTILAEEFMISHPQLLPSPLRFIYSMLHPR